MNEDAVAASGRGSRVSHFRNIVTVPSVRLRQESSRRSDGAQLERAEVYGALIVLRGSSKSPEPIEFLLEKGISDWPAQISMTVLANHGEEPIG